ncbi:MAG: hypothetical protein GQ582_05420 [Methyloprofundus sp.]|nr:hypothetical protein [Methyloprofundus sp.]
MPKVIQPSQLFSLKIAQYSPDSRVSEQRQSGRFSGIDKFKQQAWHVRLCIIELGKNVETG